MRRPLLLMAAGLATLLVAGVGWWTTRPPGDTGGAVADQLAEATTPPSSTAGPSVPVQPGSLPTADPATVPPAALRIPSIGVTARVLPVTVNGTTGEMQVPKAIDVVGWYRYGPGLDAPTGSMVIAGHVDDADQGAGAFFRLRQLGPGMRLTVTSADGQGRTYRVVARQIYTKRAVPLDRLFARTGAPRLTLITCGGSFDGAQRSYRDNIVVTAVEERR